MSVVSPHESEAEQERRYFRLELGRREPQDVPFASLLSYGSNGSPTITITKTLFSAAVTSTQTGDLAPGSLIGNVGGITTKGAGVSSASGSHTSTASHPSSTRTHASDLAGAGTPSGTIAGATLGSIAALGILGALVWFYCTRRKTVHETLRTKLRFGWRESAQAPTTPWLENQSMEETRTIMLQKSQSTKKRSSPVISEMPDTPLRRGKSMTESPVSHPSWIGLAVSSSTPLRTPPLLRSQPQVGFNHSHPAHTSPEARLHPTSCASDLDTTHQSQPERTTSSLILVPPKPVMRKPVGTPRIITNARLPKHENTSPLSPRGMFHALGNNTKEAWKRASQVLSPGSMYSVVKKEGQGGFEFLDKDGSLKKDEAGLQDSRRIEGVERRGTLFGRRRSRSSTRTDNKGWTGQWI